MRQRGGFGGRQPRANRKVFVQNGTGNLFSNILVRSTKPEPKKLRSKTRLNPIFLSAIDPTDSHFMMISKETLFAASLFPYLGFLYFLTKSGKTPRLALIGFYLLLLFVAITIPAGIYAKVAYGESLANIDWLHGSAEFFLTLSNIFVVLGFREAILQGKPSQE